MRLLYSVAVSSVLLALPLHAQLSDPFAYQSPAPSATLVSREATIILRPGPLLDRSSVTTGSVLAVDGSTSGRHHGRTLLSDDRRTLQFLPDIPFAPGEHVSVTLHDGVRSLDGTPVAARSFSFTVDRTADSIIRHARIPSEIDPDAAVEATQKSGAAAPSILSSGASDLPAMKVTTLDNPAPGRIYLSNLAFSATVVTSPHLMILDNAARPLFRQPLTHRAFDFKRQPDGTLSYFDDGLGYFVILDSSYRVVRTVSCGNGYTTDPHELLILPNRHALLLGIAPHTVDMSTIVPDGAVATVLDIVIQELDASDNVVFEWRSVDHFNVVDATHEDLTAETIDHVHPNSLEVDVDGHIIMSSRHLDEVTKIDRNTGAIIWRMGGEHNQFTFTNDPGRFSHQHDVRRLANGNIMLFDNGNYHTKPASRAVEYNVDEIGHTATMVWQYHHSPEVYGYAMGNAQRLPNGNTLIGWGSYPLVTEVRPDGKVAFEMTLPSGVFTYRAFRLPAATSEVRVALISPIDGTTDIPAQAPLTWEGTGGTSAYRLQVATDSSFATLVHDGMVTAGENATVGPLGDWTRYWWRVKAEGAEITGVWSEAWTFYTGGAPVYQTLVAPPQGTMNVTVAPTLHWGRFPGAESYQVQLSNYDASFSAPEIDTTLGSTWLWLDAIQARSRFYWRVRPIVSGEIGNWSQIWDFQTATATVEGLPEKLVPLAPLDHAQISSGDIEFRWATDGSNIAPTAYRLELAEDAGFTHPIIDSTLETPSARLAAGTLPAGSYWWRVSATNALGEQYGSPAFAFDLSSTVGVAESNLRQATSSLSPNPASGSVVLRYSSNGTSAVGIRLIDLLGRPYPMPSIGVAAPGDHAITLPLAGIPDGIYYCIVSTGATTQAHRLVISR